MEEWIRRADDPREIISDEILDDALESGRSKSNVRIPNAQRAIVGKGKVLDYLLSDSHPVGRFKASFFRRLGYSSETWDQLRSDLQKIALSEDAEPGQDSPHGQKYEIHGTLTGPLGKSALVVTVWIVPFGEDVPRFVTAFPGREG